ncbi:MAG: response regulator [Anaerolineae bacterium]
MITIEVVHEALACLYSPTDLAKTSLSGILPDSQGVTDLVQRAQIVRGILLDCIQALRPSNRSGPTASASRAYDCLKLRFVSGLTVEDASFELSLSTRQFYRDLRWAEERLTDLLHSRLQAAGGAQASIEPDALTEEVESIARKPERLSLGDVVASAVTALAGIAARYGVRLVYDHPQVGVMVTATPGILRQFIMQLLSSIVQGIAGGEVTVSLAAGQGTATLAIALSRAGGLARPDLLDAALRVAEAQGLSHRFAAAAAGTVLQIDFPLAERDTVLVVEDKPGAYALYERYLENTEFQPLHVPHPAITVEMAAKREVTAVVLDVMMPEADGWSVLQALKADPRTEAIPVVICSVVQDRELGLALGASGYLTKPVSRVDFLEGLRQVRLPHSPA